jgi:heat shock protein 5
MEWLAETSETASTEDYEEHKEQLSNLAHPITSRLYDTEEKDYETPRHGEL